MKLSGKRTLLRKNSGKFHPEHRRGKSLQKGESLRLWTEGARYISCALCVFFNRQVAKKPKSPRFKWKYNLKPGLPKKREPSPEVDELASKLIGALIEVHRKLGPGVMESMYEEAA